ncbi:hypothetical protein SBV1_gp12 [Sulfolobales Beppu virus 1]|nr:hypothetical protein SBV1_gp12 [Sulfolobales Beppu virus 1]
MIKEVPQTTNKLIVNDDMILTPDGFAIMLTDKPISNLKGNVKVIPNKVNPIPHIAVLLILGLVL